MITHWSTKLIHYTLNHIGDSKSPTKDWDAIALDIHAAGDAVNHCQDITDENGAHDSLITANNIGALQIVALTNI
nr:hypothetical protein [Tanacetum cinerariifolium]